ncbi:MAG: hypothetical protein KBD36_00670 [Alphaproteobacteria bacterium]|nr:hypothetical protein [Alphaproteobacteria bacterium]MBP9776347.1 hypothetical protein [Alphaproteobacteria bacterium]
MNLSRSLVNLDQEGLRVMEEAVRKGIAIVVSAGNNSSDSLLYHISYFYDEIKKIFVKSNEQKLFERLKGKGIVFAGSTEIGPSGKEKVSNYSHQPEDDTKKNFVLAPGEYLNIQMSTNPQELVRGTSFSRALC